VIIIIIIIIIIVFVWRHKVDRRFRGARPGSVEKGRKKAREKRNVFSL